MAATGFRGWRTTSDAGFAAPTGTRTTSSACTTAAPRRGRARTSTSRCAVNGSDRTPAQRAAALSLSRRRRSPRDDRSLHDPRGARDERRRPARRPAADRRPPAVRLFSQLPAARRHPRRRPGFIISTLNAYYVFLKFSKLWQIQHATGAAPSTLQVPPSTPLIDPPAP